MIVIYCSSHGWGHCARMLPIIDQLHEYKIEVVTTAPEWLFTTSMTKKRRYPLTIRELKTDPGAVQMDPFKIDVQKTISAHKETFSKYDDMLRDEIEYLSARGKVRLIISDISCFGVLVAEKLQVHSVCIATFDWPFIHQNIRKVDEEFSSILDQIESIAKRFDICLVPGPVCKPLSIGRQQYQLNWCARKPRLVKEEVLMRLGFAMEADLVLLTFGGHSMVKNFPKEVWRKYKDFEFLIMVPDDQINKHQNGQKKSNDNDDFESPADNVHYLSDKMWSGYHTDLVNVCDVVFGKLGYGTCAEILHCKKPFLCVKRVENPECEFLAPAMRSSVPMIEIEPERFMMGDWDDLEDLINVKRGKKYVDYKTDGEEQVARWVRYILGDKEPKEFSWQKFFVIVFSFVFSIFMMKTMKKNHII